MSATLKLDLFTTMEPCSKRASDPKGCAQRIIEFNASANVLHGRILRVERVLQGVREPTDFQLCEGQRLLRDAGVEVLTVLPPPLTELLPEVGESGREDDRTWLEKECLRIAKKSHADQPASPGSEVEKLWREARF
ncbi:hypothetical protein V8E36_004413 [Tilletia maclaganii]